MGAPEQARACNNPTGSVYSFAVTSTAIIRLHILRHTK